MPEYNPERERFEAQREAVRATYEHLELTESIITGDAGLALHGIDVRAGMDRSSPGEDKVKVDAMMTDGEFLGTRLRHPECILMDPLFLLDPERSEHHIRVPSVEGLTLFFDGIDEEYAARELHTREMHRQLPKEVTEPVVIDDCRVLPPAALAWMKNEQGSRRDFVELTLGHLAAYNNEHAAVDDPVWQEQIGRAVRCLRASMKGLPEVLLERYPTSIRELAANNFEHLAIPEEMLRRPSLFDRLRGRD
jgi:hypothetical protein